MPSRILITVHGHIWIPSKRVNQIANLICIALDLSANQLIIVKVDSFILMDKTQIEASYCIIDWDYYRRNYQPQELLDSLAFERFGDVFLP